MEQTNNMCLDKYIEHLQLLQKLYGNVTVVTAGVNNTMYGAKAPFVINAKRDFTNDTYKVYFKKPDPNDLTEVVIVID